MKIDIPYFSCNVIESYVNLHDIRIYFGSHTYFTRTIGDINYRHCLFGPAWIFESQNNFFILNSKLLNLGSITYQNWLEQINSILIGELYV